MKHLAIVGAGTAGTMMANRLAARLPEREWTITVIDKDLTHIYQPGLLFLPFGDYDERDLVRDRKMFLPANATLRLDAIERIDAEQRRIQFKGGDALTYDVLILSTGSRVVPDATEGLTGRGWYEDAFDFYTLEGAKHLRDRLARWEGGRLVLNVVDMPIKCPVAPLEFLFLADAYFTKTGRRDQVELVYATPLDGAFTKPRASAMLGHLLEDKGIKVEPSFALESVDGAAKTLKAYDEREVAYDLLVSVPLHKGSTIVEASGLGDDMAFVPTDKHTLQSKAYENIFVIGDATDLPASKAGSVAHFQSEVLTENVVAYVEGRPLPESFDGHSNCFIETGHDKAMLIDFNYETEPLPGRFPLPGVGPFTLLEESKINHWGKLGFKWVYWNMLVRGMDLPMDHRMLMHGKWS